MQRQPQSGYGRLCEWFQRRKLMKREVSAVAALPLLWLAIAPLALHAQVLSPPVQLGPTVAALQALHTCGQNIARSAPKASGDILDAQEKLFFGLAKGGYATQFGASGGGYGR